MCFANALGQSFATPPGTRGKSRVGIFWTWCDNWVLYI
jgi:hypothetical protein